MLEDLLTKQVHYLREQADRHDTDDFMDRLATRIAEESRRPARVSYAVTDTPARPAPQLPSPAPGPSTSTTHPGGPTRPVHR
ncbi:hypothetical protein [Streptomyces sp. TLI_105]|uniref:hypothetical protein n=1 Tax=Streptomyces sp. TLI_105 TaxID=1881019 RepID=UPI000895A89B|nr:hypothetical protein [Streptomyces sp. TLI_105]SED93015.1 hypothetical protein SAMN05428939_6766 [Streptomyces sp. TLI_105]